MYTGSTMYKIQHLLYYKHHKVLIIFILMRACVDPTWSDAHFEAEQISSLQNNIADIMNCVSSSTGTYP